MYYSNARLFGPLTLLALTVALCATVARADNLNPPSWHGTPLGVEGHWTQPNPFNQWTVLSYNRPVPDPSEFFNLTVTPSIVQNGNAYTVNFPNWIDLEPLKIGRIQIYWLNPTSTPPGINSITGFEGITPVPGFTTGGGAIGGLPLGTNGYFYDFFIQPNPDWEQILFTLPDGSTLSQLDINTMSIPEPASLALLAGAGLVLLRRHSA